MPSISALNLSGSTSGKAILVAATSIGTGTTIHTATSNANAIDEITLIACNTDTVPRQLTIGWGGTTDPDDLILKNYTIAANFTQPVVVSTRLSGGLIVKAAADSANKITIAGGVNRFQA